MKATLICLVAAIFSLLPASYAQEFEQYSSGFIYSDSTMKKLHFIVDSMSVKYRVCDLYKDYFGMHQAVCHYFSLDTGDVAAAKKDLEHGMGFDELVAKYPLAEHQEQLLVIRSEDNEDRKSRKIEFQAYSPALSYGYSMSFNDARYNKDTINAWIIDYSKKTEYSRERVEAFMPTQPFTPKKLPADWSRKILYVDCMIDTGASIFNRSANYDGVRYSDSKKAKRPGAIRDFQTYMRRITRYPTNRNDDSMWVALQAWDSLRFSRIDEDIATSNQFKKLLKKAVDTILATNGSDAETEQYAERYYSPAKALQMKRNRIVIGGCSQDRSPRYHALAIARLSAETINWEIFLRAHLDIMNDNFRRVSDGSYAWKGRKTYIKELEDLGLDIPALISGTSLRINNPSGTHYYGNISRLGRACAEAGNWDEIEKTFTAIMADKKLDDFNRLLGYYLYTNYLWSIEDPVRKASGIDRFHEAVTQLPEYLSKAAIAQNETFETRRR